MKKLLFILSLFLSIGIQAQTDSVTYHFPERINCTGIEFYHNDILVGTQVLTPGKTLVDYSSKFGFTFMPSDKYLNYVMTIRDKMTMLVTPNENVYIVPIGCATPVEIYTDISNNIINN